MLIIIVMLYVMSEVCPDEYASLALLTSAVVGVMQILAMVRLMYHYYYYISYYYHSY